MFFLPLVKILMVHKCFQSLIQAKQTPWKQRGTLTATAASRLFYLQMTQNRDENSFLMGGSFLRETSVKGDSVQALAQLLENPTSSVLVINQWCAGAPALQKRTKQFHIISTLSFHHSYGTTLEKINFIRRLRSFALSCFRYLEGGSQQEQGAEATSTRSFMLQLSPLCLSQKYISTRRSLIFLPGRIIHVRKINKETNLTGLNSSWLTEERLLALAVRLSQCVGYFSLNLICTVLQHLQYSQSLGRENIRGIVMETTKEHDILTFF